MTGTVWDRPTVSLARSEELLESASSFLIRPSEPVYRNYIPVVKGMDSDTLSQTSQKVCQNACSSSGSCIGILYLWGEDHSDESWHALLYGTAAADLRITPKS